ncbi:MAG: RNA-binding S4 domain-containing protein [Clostridiales Family XIII bacterium]|nr:RNA-binding S4 domain-containing protein [Clostridiales Family XIII bacterium]
MRVDKFLKVSRIIKRRTIAKEACDGGRVDISGRVAKAGSEVSVGDIVTVHFGNSDLSVRVLDLKESTRKEDAENMYETIV